MSVIYIVATPIGNLQDIVFRAIDVLRSVDLILCEDTRITKRLLDRYQIKTPTLSYHQHSKLKKVEYIIQLLKEGKDLALVSDAGTPGVSDPGNKLISFLVDQFSSFGADKLTNWQTGELKIIPIPGPSALITAASISGLPMDKFLFLGFPPHKKKRKRFFEEVVSSKYPVIFYESPYRILKSLNELNRAPKHIKRYVLGAPVNDKLSIVVCRELTKKFETIYRGTIEQVIGLLEKGEIKGEFVVIAGELIRQKENR